MVEENEGLKAATITVLDKIQGARGLPESSISQLANRMLKHDKLGDMNWLNHALTEERKRIDTLRAKARKHGYEPFINVGPKAYAYIKEQYAPWVLPFMANKLPSPEDIQQDWAIRFADTIDALGKSACEQSKNILDYVVSSHYWEESKRARDDFQLTQQKKAKSTKSGKDILPILKDFSCTPCPAKLELTFKLSQIPKSTLIGTHRVFCLDVGSHIVTIAVKPKVFKRLEDANEQWDHWIAVITGMMGDKTPKGFILERVGVSCFEKKLKPEKPDNNLILK